MTYLIGIDPGASGAIAVLDGQSFSPVEWARMPTIKVGASTRVDAAAVVDMLADFDTGEAFLEQVGAMPGQGVTSMFSFGHSTGVVTGVLAAMRIPVTLVVPQVWKRRAGIAAGSDKDAARSRARMLWPSWRALEKKGEGQAMADAALIARFGRVP